MEFTESDISPNTESMQLEEGFRNGPDGRHYTLVFCRRKNSENEEEVLLGMKKRGVGMGKWNGNHLQK